MDLVKIRFSSEDDHDLGTSGLNGRMSFVQLRGGLLVVSVLALYLLDAWGCRYEVVARAGLMSS